MDYKEFLKVKQQTPVMSGFDVAKEDLNESLFGWQKDVVQWALKRGRAALFEECGLGKTIQQLEWASNVARFTGLPVMLHCPVGVRQQTLGEARKFGINRVVPVAVCDNQDDVVPGSICIANYEKLHRFDSRQFGGVVLDESSILKNYTGKMKKLLVESYSDVRFKLACTATPAPNDHMELGTHSEFLGICDRVDMLSKYFTHDSADTSKWRLKRHGESDFWQWVSTWGICLASPADVGGNDDGYNLPDLIVDRHTVSVDEGSTATGMLFNTHGLSATNIHEEKRLTCEARMDKAVELTCRFDGPCIVWCDTNYESDVLRERLPNAVEIRGNDSEKVKESKLNSFSTGESRVIITKPSISGFGMNWQHCSHQVFAGLSYSFEAYYQAVRRSWRFGQDKPVYVDIVLADSESGIQSAISRKETDFEVMRSGMAAAMKGMVSFEDHVSRKQTYNPSEKMSVTLPKEN